MYLLSIFDVEKMIRYGGLLVIFLAVYAQTGLFFCFFVPSGVFIFTGGIFVATGQLQLDFFSVLGVSIIASVAGCATGYLFGMKAGPLLYNRKDSKFFRQKHLKAATIFYGRYGRLALTLGILFPITRTFAPIVAGIVRMKFNRFILSVFFGSVLWVLPFVSAGYLIGSIPALKEYLPYLMPAIILAVTIPAVISIVRGFKNFSKKIEDTGH